MKRPLVLDQDRLFPSDQVQRAIARRLYTEVKDLPIVSPHGHTDPRWFADDEPFQDPARLLIVPDHYVYRMLYSQGVPLESSGVSRLDGEPVEQDGRKIWRLFAERWHLFRGTPTRTWFEHSLHQVFGVREQISAESADRIYDQIDGCLKRPEYRPRALFEKFNLEVLATTESPLDPLPHHQKLRASGWKGRVITTFRPDPVVDPDYEGFAGNVAELGGMTRLPATTWSGCLAALQERRDYFRRMGATATDHGHPSART